MAPHASHHALPRGTNRVRLNVELLEARDVPSTVSVDTTQFATDHILVRWADDAPTATGYSAGWDSLGNNTYSVKLAAGVTVSQAVDYYSRLTGVDFAQPDYVLKIARTANDTYTTNQWGLDAINAPTAWNYTTGSKAVVVAVIDTGVDYLGTDLAGNIWRNNADIPGNGIDDDGNGYADDVHGWDFVNNDAAPMDDNGHGTHVAGIIGAVGNNGTGITGVAWNVQIMPLKFMDANGAGYVSNAVKAVNYAVRMGAKIINNSWTAGGLDVAMAQALTYAQSRGVLVVNAAGNDGTNNDVTPRYPASYAHDNILRVAAVDQNKNLASYSNYGTSVDIAAPGSSILSYLPGNRYAYYSGTSMATPFVTGAAALVWSAHPEYSYHEVIAALMNSATRLPSLAGKVKTGLLNVGLAISHTMPQQAPTITTPTTPTPSTPTTGTPAVSITSAVFNGGTGYFNSVRVAFSAAVNPATFDASDITLIGPNGKTIAVQRVSAVAGSSTQFNIYFAPQRSAGSYQIKIGTDVRDLSNRTPATSFATSQSLSTMGSGTASKASIGTEATVAADAAPAWNVSTQVTEAADTEESERASEPTHHEIGCFVRSEDFSGGFGSNWKLGDDSDELERRLEALFIKL